ncbi:hypothetical protein [Pseudomonas fluorescens]|uniref:hypothetical protein n=1 Tax=Pseudomonas fluorescens TaxID=294 RepID=UPI00124082A9|nr:hypothetical protein [Pseudomonas fluorescens]
MSAEEFERLDGVVTGLSSGDSAVEGEVIRTLEVPTAGQVVQFKFKYEFRGNEVPIELISYKVTPGNGRGEGKLSVAFMGAPYYGYIGGELTRKALQDGAEHGLRYGQVMTQRPGEGIYVMCQFQLDTPGGDPPKESRTYQIKE